MQTFLVTYDTAAGIVNQKQLDAFITSNKYISEWSFAFTGCYFVKSNAEVEDLYNSLESFFSGVRFVSIRLEKHTRDWLNGRLADAVWQWIAGADDEKFAAAVAERNRRKHEN